MNNYQGNFWKIVGFFSLLLTPISLLWLWTEGDLQVYFEMIIIIILSLLFLSLGQKQVTSLGINSLDQEVILKVYRPFRKVKLFTFYTCRYLILSDLSYCFDG